jgi:hypothetical protein
VLRERSLRSRWRAMACDDGLAADAIVAMAFFTLENDQNEDHDGANEPISDTDVDGVCILTLSVNSMSRAWSFRHQTCA